MRQNPICCSGNLIFLSSIFVFFLCYFKSLPSTSVTFFTGMISSFFFTYSATSSRSSSFSAVINTREIPAR